MELQHLNGLSFALTIEKIVAGNIVPGSVEAILGRYKRKKKLFASLTPLFDNVAASLGPDILVKVLEETLTTKEH